MRAARKWSSRRHRAKRSSKIWGSDSTLRSEIFIATSKRWTQLPRDYRSTLSVTRRNMGCQISGIVSDTEQDSRPSAVKPRHSEKVQPLVVRDSPLLDGIPIRIDNWQLHQTEVEVVARRPEHRQDSRALEVEFSDDILVVAVTQLRYGLARYAQARPGNVVIDPLERVGLELVNLGESILYVLRDYETPLASVSDVPKQHDTVAGKLMQVQTLAPVLPGDLWMWVELFRWRFQGLYLGVKHSHAREPITDILAAISSGHTPGAADREIDFPSTLIEFLGNLRSGLPGSHHEHCTRWKG